jgi:hypothetical protein
VSLVYYVCICVHVCITTTTTALASAAAEHASRLLELEGYADMQAYKAACDQKDRLSLEGRREVAASQRTLELCTAVMEAEIAEEER